MCLLVSYITHGETCFDESLVLNPRLKLPSSTRGQWAVMSGMVREL